MMASERTTEHVPLINETPFVAFVVPWSVRPPRASLTVVVKGTFALGHGDEPTTVARDQRPPQGDVRAGDDPAGSLTYASDFAPFKPLADITLIGHGFPSGDCSAGFVELAVQNAITSRIAIFGPRSWDAWGAQTAPRPFERVPLGYEYAFGGPGFPPNPVGLGRSGKRLPQLEHPRALVRSRTSGASPACLAPVAPEWQSRSNKLGTYGRAWLRERWPYFPEDFDWRYFNAAPDALQVPYLRGDESFSIRGVRPEGAVRGSLPARTVRVIAVHRADGGLVEARAHLDTVHFDTDAMELVACWRAVVEVSDLDGSDLRAFFVSAEPLDALRSIPEIRAALERERDADPPSEEQPRSSELLPRAGIPTRDAVVVAVNSGHDLRGASWGGADLSGLNLRGRDLRAAVLTGADLTGADFTESKLGGARLDRARAVGASFRRTDLTAADLSHAVLDRAIFDEAILVDATLEGATLREASWVGARAKGVVMPGVNAEGADFTRADLCEADLSDAALANARFVECQLRDARLYDGRAERAFFDRAEAADVRADGLRAPWASFVGIDAPGASFEAARLEAARFSHATLSGANFARAHLDGAIIDGCDLRRASFRKATLNGAWLTGSDLMQADVDHARAQRVVLRGASLYQAETWGADLKGAQLEGAHVAGSKLEGRR